MTRSKQIIALMAAALTISAVSCANSDKNTPDTGKRPAPTGSTEPADPIRGQTITWLADYDLNPAKGAERSTALAIYEDFYGAKVDFIRTTQETKFADLDKMINSGDEVDMFPYEADVPLNSMSRRFQPLDEYFGILENEGVDWVNMRNAIDVFACGGEHYVVPYSNSDAQVLTYSRKLFKEEELDDPYELFLKGKWDWDVMMEMMEKFIGNAKDKNKRFGICGDFGQAAINSTGHSIVEWTGTKLIDNVDSYEADKAEFLMRDIVNKGWYKNGEFDSYPNDNSALFYAMGDWSFGETNAQNPDSEMWVVPFPKMPGAKDNYLTCQFNAKLLVKGSEKGEAVAAYINCERIAVTNEKYMEDAKKLATETSLRAPGMLKYCMSGEQYDAVMECRSLSNSSPVIECGYTLGRRVSGGTGLTDDQRGIMEKLTRSYLKGRPAVPAWEELCSYCKEIIDEEINN